jgi:hypothetical protein
LRKARWMMVFFDITKEFFTTESTEEKHGEHKALIVCNLFLCVSLCLLSDLRGKFYRLF